MKLNGKKIKKGLVFGARDTNGKLRSWVVYKKNARGWLVYMAGTRGRKYLRKFPKVRKDADAVQPADSAQPGTMPLFLRSYTAAALHTLVGHDQEYDAEDAENVAMVDSLIKEVRNKLDKEGRDVPVVTVVVAKGSEQESDPMLYLNIRHHQSQIFTEEEIESMGWWGEISEEETDEMVDREMSPETYAEILEHVDRSTPDFVRAYERPGSFDAMNMWTQDEKLEANKEYDRKHPSASSLRKDTMEVAPASVASSNNRRRSEYRGPTSLYDGNSLASRITGRASTSTTTSHKRRYSTNSEDDFDTVPSHVQRASRVSRAADDLLLAVPGRKSHQKNNRSQRPAKRRKGRTLGA